MESTRLFLQKRKTELREFIDKSNVKTVVDELLEKAKKIHLSEKIVVFVEEEIMCLPDVDVARVGKKISNIIEWNNYVLCRSIKTAFLILLEILPSKQKSVLICVISD